MISNNAINKGARMTVEHREIDDIFILKLSGELSIFFKEEPELILQKEIEKGRTKFILDLSEVSYIDSSGLSLIILAGTNAAKEGLTVKLINPTPQVRLVLDIAHIEPIISIEASEEKAIQSFKS